MTTTDEFLIMAESILTSRQFVTSLIEKRPFRNLNDQDALYLAEIITNVKGTRNTSHRLTPEQARKYLSRAIQTEADLRSITNFLKNKKIIKHTVKESRKAQQIGFLRTLFRRLLIR